jgi:hypothetical protein
MRTLPLGRLALLATGGVATLHVSLALRLGIGDAHGVASVWQVGGLLNILAVLLFVAVAARVPVVAS